MTEQFDGCLRCQHPRSDHRDGCLSCDCGGFVRPEHSDGSGDA